MIKIFSLLFKDKSSKKNNIFSSKNLINIISPRYKKNFFPWGIFFADVFYFNKGFDIVISNPPYINTREISTWRKT